MPGARTGAAKRCYFNFLRGAPTLLYVPMRAIGHLVAAVLWVAAAVALPGLGLLELCGTARAYGLNVSLAGLRVAANAPVRCPMWSPLRLPIPRTSIAVSTPSTTRALPFPSLRAQYSLERLSPAPGKCLRLDTRSSFEGGHLVALVAVSSAPCYAAVSAANAHVSGARCLPTTPAPTRRTASQLPTRNR